MNLDSTQKRIRIISDLHLGNPGSLVANASELFPFLENTDILILNGDTLQDLHPVWFEKSKQIFAKLEEKAQELGVEIIRTAGNHDPNSAPRQAIQIDDGKILVTHGDAFYPQGSPWARDMADNWDNLLPLMRQIPDCGNDLQKRVELAGEISATLRAYKPVPQSKTAEYIRLAQEPQRMLKIVQGLFWMWKVADDFIRKYAPQTQLLIFGHFHQNAIKTSHGVKKVCMGSFLNKLNASVIDIHQGEVSIHKVIFDTGRFNIHRDVKSLVHL